MEFLVIVLKEMQKFGRVWNEEVRYVDCKWLLPERTHFRFRGLLLLNWELLLLELIFKSDVIREVFVYLVELGFIDLDVDWLIIPTVDYWLYLWSLFIQNSLKIKKTYLPNRAFQLWPTYLELVIEILQFLL